MRQGASGDAGVCIGCQAIPGEGDMLFNGPMVLVIAFGALALLWIIVLVGSPFFGPRES
jgi:hypothetical protein